MNELVFYISYSTYIKKKKRQKIVLLLIYCLNLLKKKRKRNLRIFLSFDSLSDVGFVQGMEFL